VWYGVHAANQTHEKLLILPYVRIFHNLIYTPHTTRHAQKACTRCFWKHEPAGQFARDHHKVLQSNGWEHLAQEVLISTPRRFGKTISVSMFAAAMMWAAPSVEISIYSTCKRISQKLLRNCIKFFYEICKQDLPAAGFKVLRQNMEEIVLRGPGGTRDQRVVNSYPSKVGLAPCCKSLLCVVPTVCFRCVPALRAQVREPSGDQLRHSISTKTT
jgi:hypothetical protein